MKKLTKFVTITLALFPAVVLAQLTNTTRLISRIGDLVRTLILVVAGIALLVFFWGLAKFILKVGGDEKAVDQGKALMKWGLIALFIMMSVWGIIRFFQNGLLPWGNLAPPPGIGGGGTLTI